MSRLPLGARNSPSSAFRWALLLAAMVLVLTACGLAIPPAPANGPPAAGSGTPAADGKAQSPQGRLVVTFIDVGQGDAVLVQSPAGENILIDGGPDSRAYRFLARQEVRRLNAVIATHPHSDHIGGLPEVLRNSKVDAVWTNGQEHTTPAFEDFLDAIAASGAKYREAHRGDVIRVGELEFNVLSPGAKPLADLNENSLVLRLQYKEASFLFTGDAGETAERLMLESGQNLRSTVLKIAHHGSNSASSEPFLKSVRPAVAVWMASRDNDYGHPHRETLERLAQIGTRVFGTAVDGTVVVSTDGERFWVNTAAGREMEITVP